jgi:transcriptional regulator with PAS, ATPase and Fis domain
MPTPAAVQQAPSAQELAIETGRQAMEERRAEEGRPWSGLKGRNKMQYAGIVSVPKPVSTELLLTGESAAYACLQLQEAERHELLRAALDALPNPVVVLDECGMIVLANATWRRFAANTGLGGMNYGIGMKFLNVCQAAAGPSPDLESVSRGIRGVLEQQRDEYVVDYQPANPDTNGSFRVRVTRFQFAGAPHAIVSHEPLSEIKQAQEGLQQALGEIARLKERLQAENLYLQEEIKGAFNFDDIVGESASLRRVFHKVEQVAPTDSNVLILGETGTGKELIARAIHSRSPRQHRPLVKVNCAALPSTLIESEFFGHEKGAFTGALTRKIGRFELADGGTIFLDEIGDLALELQAKLLRVLQEGEFERIGSTTTLKVNVRVIAATNRKLEKEVAAGTFRPDLYYRLSVFPIELPPLRERRDDIPLLVWFFVGRSQRKLGKSITEIPKRIMDALISYSWPGNVRELENVIERAVILSPGPTLRVDESFVRVVPRHAATTSGRSLEEIERAHILRVIEECGGRIKGSNNAAARLGLNPSTLRSRMKKLSIQRPDVH